MSNKGDENQKPLMYIVQPSYDESAPAMQNIVRKRKKSEKPSETNKSAKEDAIEESVQEPVSQEVKQKKKSRLRYSKSRRSIKKKMIHKIESQYKNKKNNQKAYFMKQKKNQEENE